MHGARRRCVDWAQVRVELFFYIISFDGVFHTTPKPNPHTYGVRRISRSTPKRTRHAKSYRLLHIWLPNSTPNGVSSLFHSISSKKNHGLIHN